MTEIGHTSRLHIEPLRSHHAAELFNAFADAQLYEYVPESPYTSVDALADRYARLERGAPPNSDEVWLNWALRRIDNGGCIGTLQATVTRDESAYIAYVIAADSWGRGFATEACRWLVAELSAKFRATRLIATVDVRHARSIRVLERLGFISVGTEAAELKGMPSTDYRYELLLPLPDADAKSPSDL